MAVKSRGMLWCAWYRNTWTICNHCLWF